MKREEWGDESNVDSPFKKRSNVGLSKNDSLLEFFVVGVQFCQYCRTQDKRLQRQKEEAK